MNPHVSNARHRASFEPMRTGHIWFVDKKRGVGWRWSNTDFCWVTIDRHGTEIREHDGVFNDDGPGPTDEPGLATIFGWDACTKETPR